MLELVGINRFKNGIIVVSYSLDNDQFVFFINPFKEFLDCFDSLREVIHILKVLATLLLLGHFDELEVALILAGLLSLNEILLPLVLKRISSSIGMLGGSLVVGSVECLIYSSHIY